jgi:SAM-dependent methyltransferase
VGVDLSRRVDEPELLDLGVSDEEARRSLADLRFVNRWLGNRRALLRDVRSLVRGVPGARLLDVGCGSGDVPAYLVRALGQPLLAVGLDLKHLHLQALPPEVLPVQADVTRLPFPENAFDVVTASLFLHHFGEADLAPLLAALYAVARRGLIINDLRRTRLPYVFGRAVFPLLFRTNVSVEDGLLSIRRGFTEDELRTAFGQAGIPARIRRTFPYRLLAVAEKAA